MQASLIHQFANGLYFQAAYTWSKTLDNGSGSAFGDELNGLLQFGDYLNTNSNRGVADFDRRHRFVVTYDYTLPFARWAGISNSGIGKLAHGWFMSGMITFQSGNPFTVIDSSALTLEDTDGINAFNFASLAPGQTLKSALTTGTTENRVPAYLNMDAFVVGGNCVTAQNTLVACSASTAVAAAVGNVRRNVFRGPFQQNWDMSFGKTTKLTEKMSMDFRAEFFNIFNHPSFQPPAAGGIGSIQGNTGLVDIATGDSSIAGTVTRPRIIQFAAKIRF
jgi:hypothetical protein